MQEKDNVAVFSNTDTFYFNFVDTGKLDLIIEILNCAKTQRVLNISHMQNKYFISGGCLIDLCFIVNDIIKEDSL